MQKKKKKIMTPNFANQLAAVFYWKIFSPSMECSLCILLTKHINSTYFQCLSWMQQYGFYTIQPCSWQQLNFYLQDFSTLQKWLFSHGYFVLWLISATHLPPERMCWNSWRFVCCWRSSLIYLDVEMLHLFLLEIITTF